MPIKRNQCRIQATVKRFLRINGRSRRDRNINEIFRKGVWIHSLVMQFCDKTLQISGCIKQIDIKG